MYRPHRLRCALWLLSTDSLLGLRQFARLLSWALRLVSRSSDGRDCDLMRLNVGDDDATKQAHVARGRYSQQAMNAAFV